MKSILWFTLFNCFAGIAVTDKKPERPVPALNSVTEVSLQTTYSNDSDSSTHEKTSLYLSDYDKKYNIAFLSATGDYEKPGSKDFVPYIKEICDGGTCGLTPLTDAKLDAVTLAVAKAATKAKAPVSAKSMDKKMFTNGSVWIVESEATDKIGGKKWSVTLAVELQKMALNTKYIGLKYKVLEFVAK